MKDMLREKERGREKREGGREKGGKQNLECSQLLVKSK